MRLLHRWGGVLGLALFVGLAGLTTLARPAQAAQATGTQAVTATATQQVYTLPPDKLKKAEALGLVRELLSLVGGPWGIVVLWLLLATGAASGFAARVERMLKRRWLQGLAFFAAGIVAVMAVVDLPIAAVGHAVSLKYGISVQGWPSWLGDVGKAVALNVLIGAPILLLFNWVVRRWPRRYWLAAWLVAVPLVVLGAFASPLLEPVFNKFEPLAKSNPALAADLERVVARAGLHIPLDQMYLMKASVKTRGINAYVSGLGSTRRVVVWDTTAGKVPNDEVLFILGHETGHYVLHHIVKGMIAGIVGLFFAFWLCAQVAEWLVRRFGGRWKVESVGSRAGFVVLLLTFAMAQFVAEPVANSFSRYQEHQADIYGQEAIHGLVPDPQKTTVAAFQTLGEAWLEDPNPNPFVVFWDFSHPSVQQRATFAAHYDPWKNGGRGKYFSN